MACDELGWRGSSKRSGFVLSVLVCASTTIGSGWSHCLHFWALVSYQSDGKKDLDRYTSVKQNVKLLLQEAGSGKRKEYEEYKGKRGKAYEAQSPKLKHEKVKKIVYGVCGLA